MTSAIDSSPGWSVNSSTAKLETVVAVVITMARPTEAEDPPDASASSGEASSAA